MIVVVAIPRSSLLLPFPLPSSWDTFRSPITRCWAIVTLHQQIASTRILQFRVPTYFRDESTSRKERRPRTADTCEGSPTTAHPSECISHVSAVARNGGCCSPVPQAQFHSLADCSSFRGRGGAGNSSPPLSTPNTATGADPQVLIGFRIPSPNGAIPQGTESASTLRPFAAREPWRPNEGTGVAGTGVAVRDR
jgi:hypothetical protein